MTKKEARAVFGAEWWFIKAWDWTCGQKELLPQGSEEWLIIYYGVGGGKEKRFQERTFIC